MNTSEQLAGYYPNFSEDTLAKVTDAAARQSKYTSYQQYFADLGIPEELQTYTTNSGQPLQVLDIRPKEYDPAQATVIHLPMANPLDPNQIFQIATMAEANSNTRIIATGNPSVFGYKSGVLSRYERKRMANGDFQPMAGRLNGYLDKTGIEIVNQVGYSFGADLAAEAATSDSREVSKIIVIEPAAVVMRSLGGLATAFSKTASSLSEYVNATDQPLFKEARKNSVGAMAYNLGLLRATNIAVGRGLAKVGTENRLMQAMNLHSKAEVTLAWGSESELAIDGLTSAIATRLNQVNANRLRTIRMDGHRHALANNIYLHAAIVHEGLN